MTYASSLVRPSLKFSRCAVMVIVYDEYGYVRQEVYVVSVVWKKSDEREKEERREGDAF